LLYLNAVIQYASVSCPLSLPLLLSNLTVTLVALHQPADPGFIPKAISNPPRAKYTDLERRRQLCRLAKEAAIFANGKVPDPFTSSHLGNGATPEAEDLPFIYVESIAIANAEDPSTTHLEQSLQMCGVCGTRAILSQTCSVLM